MKSHGFMIDFKDEAAVLIYTDLHKDVWPEVKDAFASIGLRTMQLFHMPPLQLFMYVEAEERFVVNRDFKTYVDLHPRVREWDELCGNLLTRIPSNRGITDWAEMDKLYSYDRREHRVLF
jgi:L-rhamnose mutarotase